VRNILFSNFEVHGATLNVDITENSGGNSSTQGSSLMEVSNVVGVSPSNSTNASSLAKFLRT
jgi:galacturan 1,4-alpha-galacturonidase